MGSAKKTQPADYQVSLLARLTDRFSLFLALQFIVTLALYISGCFQEFLTSTENLLLTCCTILAVMLFVFCLAGMVLSVITFMKNRRGVFWIKFAFYLSGFILSPITMIVIRVITFLEDGI